MRKFFIKSSLLFGAMILFTFLFQKIIDKFIKHSTLLYFQTWNDLIESKVKSDLIIQGSSRAKVQFSPYVIDSVFHLNSCNLGMEGTGFDLQYCRFQLLIKNNKKPIYIIQNVDCTSTLSNNIFQIEQYIPYLDNDIIKKATIETGIFNFKDFYIPLYKYTHSLFIKDIIINGISDYFKNIHGKGAYENFTSNNAAWDTSFALFQKSKKNGFRSKIAPSSNDKFGKFLRYCKNQNIKIILVYAPEYKGLQNLILNRDSIISIYQMYSLKYNATFLDYSDDSICLDTINFYNSQHLNTNGVRKFNLKLVNDLKRIIK